MQNNLVFTIFIPGAVYVVLYSSADPSARIRIPFKEELRNRFPAWRVGMTTLFDVSARQAT
jgi:hypothetical protein